MIDIGIDTESWPDPPVVVVRPWSGMEFVRTGFGGVLYFRSLKAVEGVHCWAIDGCPPPYNPGKDTDG